MNQVSFNKVRLSLAVLLCLCATSMVNAKVKLPALISDGMVLQREQPIKVWGTADAGESVQVKFLKNATPTGVKVALDDFGTGNSSLSLALELPFDELKVDMSFIRDIKDKPQNQAMVQSIIDYAKRTSTETCIEGIENREVDDYIKKFGATWHQGYYYSKPVPIEEFDKIIHKTNKIV